MNDCARARVIYSGTVQGVGFRFTVRRTASGFAVAGQVRNLPDGTVELIAEGGKAEATALLKAVDAAMAGYITDRQIEWSEARGSFDGFQIAF